MTTVEILIDLLVIIPLALFILLIEWAKQNPPDEGGSAKGEG